MPTIDPTEIFADASTEAAKTALQESLQQELSSRGFSSIFIGVAAEVAKSIAGHLMGPLLGVFLKLIDPAQKRLDLLISEPLQTGVRLARIALTIRPENSNDERLANEYFSGSLQNLEKAFTLSATMGKIDDCMRIRITQAAIARMIGATGSVRIFLQDWNQRIHSRMTECTVALHDVQKELASPQSTDHLTALQLEAAESALNKFLSEPVRLRLPDPLSSRSRVNWINLEANDDTRYSLICKALHKAHPSGGIFIVSLMNDRLRMIALQRKLEELSAFKRFWEL
jgi:hypothetical protein